MSDVEITSPNPEQLEPPETVSLRELDGFQKDLADLAEMVEELRFDEDGKLSDAVITIAGECKEGVGWDPGPGQILITAEEVEWPDENPDSVGSEVQSQTISGEGPKKGPGGEPEGSS